MSPDTRIIGSVIKLTKEKEEPVILITNDVAMRFNAFAISKNGITIQDYKNETIETDESYTGKTKIEVDSKSINKLYQEKEFPIDEIKEFIPDDEKIYENEYIHLVSDDGKNQSAICIFQKGFIYLINADVEAYGGIHGKNLTQKCLINALLRPAEDIPLVIAKGPAGTGKTLLSVACGLSGTYDDKNSDVIQKSL